MATPKGMVGVVWRVLIYRLGSLGVARNTPARIWFPPGKPHRIFVPGLAWSGSDPPVRRPVENERDIEDLAADQVAATLAGMLKAQAQRAAANGGA